MSWLVFLHPYLVLIEHLESRWDLANQFRSTLAGFGKWQRRPRLRWPSLLCCSFLWPALARLPTERIKLQTYCAFTLKWSAPYTANFKFSCAQAWQIKIRMGRSTGRFVVPVFVPPIMILMYHLLNVALIHLNVTSDILWCPEQHFCL